MADEKAHKTLEHAFPKDKPHTIVYSILFTRMGNNIPQNTHRKQKEIEEIWIQAQTKANQILTWYQEERFRDTIKVSSVSDHIYKPFGMLKSGRSIGTIGVKKVLKIITPLRLINKVNPSLALLFSMILTSVDDLEVTRSRFKHQSANTNLPQDVKTAIEKVRFGKDMCQILQKILNDLQNQLALIGHIFQEDNSLVNYKNLMIWADWASLHWTALVVAYIQTERQSFSALKRYD